MPPTPPGLVVDVQPTASDALAIGSVLDDRYRIDELIGCGGMGLVYRGHHVGLDATVAIKVIRPDLASDPTMVARFIDEAHFTATSHDDRVVRMLEVGHRPGGGPFIVLEFLEGKDLASVLATHGALPLSSTLAYAIDICVGLAAVHRQAVVHRDIKPSNLGLVATSVDGPGRVKILDFGIAERRERARSDSSNCPTSSLGSPHHMSPEQFTGAEAIDGRSDIWSLGVVVYQMLVGRLPFVGDDVSAICEQILSHDPIEPSAIRVEVPPELSALVMRCLEKSRDDRPAAVAFVEWELHQIRRRFEQRTRVSEIRALDPRSARETDLREEPTVRVRSHASRR